MRAAHLEITSAEVIQRGCIGLNKPLFVAGIETQQRRLVVGVLSREGHILQTGQVRLCRAIKTFKVSFLLVCSSAKISVCSRVNRTKRRSLTAR